MPTLILGESEFLELVAGRTVTVGGNLLPEPIQVVVIGMSFKDMSNAVEAAAESTFEQKLLDIFHAGERSEWSEKDLAQWTGIKEVRS